MTAFLHVQDGGAAEVTLDEPIWWRSRSVTHVLLRLREYGAKWQWRGTVHIALWATAPSAHTARSGTDSEWMGSHAIYFVQRPRVSFRRFVCASLAFVERMPLIVGDLIASRRGWSPIGTRVVLHIDDCGDHRFIGVRVSGTIRACGMDSESPPLLMELSRAILRYDGHFTSQDPLEYLVLVPALRVHGCNRLLIAWTAVRIVAAASFRDSTYNRTIGTGRLMLA